MCVGVVWGGGGCEVGGVRGYEWLWVGGRWWLRVCDELWCEAASGVTVVVREVEVVREVSAASPIAMVIDKPLRSGQHV